MKAAVLLTLAAVATATPVLLERQGPGFPSACNTQCSDFFPVYATCEGVTSSYLDLLDCLAVVCPATMWNKLGPCLSCWETATGQPATPYWSLFNAACA